jgi:hypothetical protein
VANRIAVKPLHRCDPGGHEDPGHGGYRAPTFIPCPVVHGNWLLSAEEAHAGRVYQQTARLHTRLARFVRLPWNMH